MHSEKLSFDEWFERYCMPLEKQLQKKSIDREIDSLDGLVLDGVLETINIDDSITDGECLTGVGHLLELWAKLQEGAK